MRRPNKPVKPTPKDGAARRQRQAPIMLPRFEMTEDRPADAVAVLGVVSSTRHGHETWVGDGWVGYLTDGASLIPGRWSGRAERWSFAPDSSEHLDAIRGRREWSVLDGYWGERAALVLDRHRQWLRARFEPRDAVQFEGNGGVRLPEAAAGEEGAAITGGWDHEHCAICWQTLGPSGQPDGWLNRPRTWVCDRCYVEFVSTRSLGFVDEQPNFPVPPR